MFLGKALDIARVLIPQVAQSSIETLRLCN